MKVVLAAEGTYPHQFGGVSVWCDQLIRGLPRHDFTLIPLVATGNEAMRWQLPGNVESVRTIPLWGRPPAVPMRSRLSRRRNDSLLTELIDVLLSPPAQAQDRFTAVMHELFSYGQAHDLRTLLASEDAVRVLGDTWRERWPQILEVRGLGAMLAMELADPALASEVVVEALQRGLLLLKAGVTGDCIRVLVPLVVTDGELDEALAAWEQALEAAL